MNFVFLSPQFPPNYYRFCVQLNALGVNVLGLADEPYQNLRHELQSAMKEYYLVNNMHRYDDLIRALGHFTHRYGKIDRIDSLNEYWLETEARLRTDFNIQGIKLNEIEKIKRKSLMKEQFRQAGVPVARGKVVHDLESANLLISEIGFPVVAKPDIGVGAAKTYKIHNRVELEDFFRQKPDVEYIMEEFINGAICSFDGITDYDGNLVFYTSHQFSQGIMETVNKDDLIYYYSLRQIPPDLEDAGRRVLKIFNVRERFFHFEFFRAADTNEIIALEVNMRPPGGLTTDMFNYANDIDVYTGWAELMVNNQFGFSYSRPYYCAYIGRKNELTYAHHHGEIISQFGNRIVYFQSIEGVFRGAIGDFGYLVRSPDLTEVLAMAAFIRQKV